MLRWWCNYLNYEIKHVHQVGNNKLIRFNVVLIWYLLSNVLKKFICLSFLSLCVVSKLLQLHDHIILLESADTLIKHSGFFLSWGDGERPLTRCSVEYCASYDWSIRNNYERIRPEPSVAPRSPVGHRTTEGHPNEHCTQHSYSAAVNRFDFYWDVDWTEDRHNN
jgi:hypothetical protein